MGAVHVAGAQRATLQVAELVEHEQRVITGAAEVAVIGRALLLTECRADGAVHVEHHAPRRIVVVNPVDPHPRQVRKGREVLVVRQQLGLEPPHLAGRCPAALDRLAADDPAHRGIKPEPVGVVDILVAGETPIDGLAKETDGMDAPYHGVMCARTEFGFELQTEGASTMDITTIGFDLAKTVFQVHGADGEGRVVLRRKLRRGKVLALFAGLPTCLVGMEACASAHYWARELQALGHEVRLIPPQYVRPFVKTNKNDAADAEAICEAVTRPTMRFAAAKSSEQQSVLMLHRARELLVRQRTMVINALRGHCAELGLIVAQGPSKVEELVAIIEDPDDGRLPPLAREALGMLVEQLRSAQARIKVLEATLLAWHRSNQASRRLATIPGVGVITATALVATIGDGAQFRSGRQLSAWLGLVPRQHSSGGKDRLGRISKRGDGYIRRLLVHGARTVLRWRRVKPGPRPGWTDQLLARRPTNVVLVAMANKTARVAWALLRYERIYEPVPA